MDAPHPAVPPGAAVAPRDDTRDDIRTRRPGPVLRVPRGATAAPGGTAGCGASISGLLARCVDGQALGPPRPSGARDVAVGGSIEAPGCGSTPPDRTRAEETPMSVTAGPPTPPVREGRALGAWVLRGLTAAGLLLSADVHLVLFVEGYRDIDVVGPLFALNAVAGLVLGLLVLVWRHWLPLLGAVGFGALTLAAFYLSTTVGFFGVNETVGGTQQVLAAVSEWVVVVAGTLALVVERRRSRAARP